MRISKRLFFAVFCGIAVMTAGLSCAHAAAPLSKYGQIQNVQNYSTNPFWSPGAPYNQRMPQPVYATGPDVETADCQTVVANLVATQCAMRNNCVGASLSDIRPAVMMELSRMPGHNYATACAGYVDTAYQTYVSQYATAAPTGFPTAFPDAAMPSPEPAEYEIKNPLSPGMVPTWLQEMKERTQELEELQSQNGAGGEKIVRADFPKTTSDLSFTDRMQNAAAGYAPYSGTSAYQQIKIESKEQQLNRVANEVAQRQAMADAIYCATHNDPDRCGKGANTQPIDNNTTTPTAPEQRALIDRIMELFPR